MKKKLTQTLEVPQGITCKIEGNELYCKSGSVEIKRNVAIPRITLLVKGNMIEFVCEKGNKNDYKKIMSQRAHLKNMFNGVKEPFVYKLEACNVHFPMTMKVEGKKLVVNNFLGEKTPRSAEILDNVKIDVKGAQITLTSPDREAAGQTAANIERSVRITGRDRRIFQDGIFITERPGRTN